MSSTSSCIGGRTALLRGELADEGVVASRVGRGTRIVDTPPLSLLDLDREVEVLVARARSAGVSAPELLALVRRVAARG